MFKLAGTKLCFSTSYHPQSDGQTEVTNMIHLRYCASEKPRTWYKYLAWTELSYNTSHHLSIQMTPFQALYGREPPTLVRFENGSTTNADLENRLVEKDAMMTIIQQHLLRPHQVMKQQADEHRRNVDFQVRDLVFLKLRPYRQHSLARKSNEKLAARFYGPFAVEERVRLWLTS